MASALPPILVEIQADVASLKKGLADAQSALKGIDTSVEKTGSTMTNFMDRVKQVGATLGVAFAGSQIISFFRESITAANDASNAQERLATLLENTNGGTKAQIAALIEQADALEAVGVVSKDNIIVAQSQLATFDLTASTIKTLTPAILDYVTAEKGAAASADDYRQMTNSLAQALNGNFASLTRVGFVLDETTKKQISSGTESERAAAIVEVLNSTYKGFNETLRDNNPLQAAINDLGKLKGDIGEALLPVIDQLSRFISDNLIPGLRKMAHFIKENKDAILVFTGVLAAGYAAMKIYHGIIVLTTAAKKLYQVATVIMRGGQLATIASTNTLAASMLRLNAIMKANPIGIVVTAVALLAAGIVTLWKRSETFRTVVINVAKAALNAFASIIPMVAKVFEAIMKVNTGPMRLLLLALSKLPGVGKYAKTGLDAINKGLDKISDFGKKAADQAKKLSKELDGLAKKGKSAADEVKKAVDPFAGDTRGNKGGGPSDKTISKIEKLQQKVADIYEKMNEAILKAQEEAEEALIRRNEKMAEAHERYHEKVAELNERYREDMESAQERYDEAVKDARERNAENLIDIAKDYKEKMIDLEAKREETIASLREGAAEKLADIEAKYQEKVTDLRRNAEEKAADIVKAGAEKRQNILQQSMDRLRSAFTSGTAFNVADIFKESQSDTGVLEGLRKRLDAAKLLQENAAKLAGMGYSQTFIEQVVKAGPEMGNKMADALANASPESTAEIQALYKDLETLNNDGLNTLAESMNSGGNLATKELIKAYEAASIEVNDKLKELNADLQANLAQAHIDYTKQVADTNAELNKGLAKAQSDFEKASVEAAKVRDERIRESLEALNKALTKAEEDLTKSQLDAKKRLDKGLAEAAQELSSALAAAQAEYESAIAEINKRLAEQLEDLNKELAKAAAELAALGATKEAADALANAPTGTIIVPVASPYPSGTTTVNPTSATSTTVNITGVNLTDPTDTANSVINAIKFGNVIVPTAPTALASKESGAIGAASIRSRITKAPIGGGGNGAMIL